LALPNYRGINAVSDKRHDNVERVYERGKDVHPSPDRHVVCNSVVFHFAARMRAASNCGSKWDAPGTAPGWKIISLPQQQSLGVIDHAQY